MPLESGTTFAGYRIIRLLGSGGIGEVYLAQHPRLSHRGALKVLSAGMTADNDFRERFHREADLAATLFHPHIVVVHDRGEFEGHLWIPMDYVDSTDAGQSGSAGPWQTTTGRRAREGAVGDFRVATAGLLAGQGSELA
jgi:serine/threonine-protein kinase